MPDIASVNAGEVATLSDLCDLIEGGSEEERERLYRALIAVYLDGKTKSMSDWSNPPQSKKEEAAKSIESILEAVCPELKDYKY